MQPHIRRDEMPPSRQATIPPAAEDARAERQAPALQKGEEAAREAGAVDVHEVPVAPVVLEVRSGREAEFGRLRRAVAVPGAGDAVDDGDVEGEVEGCGGVGRLVGVFAVWVVLFIGEEEGEGWRAGGCGCG